MIVVKINVTGDLSIHRLALGYSLRVHNEYHETIASIAIDQNHMEKLIESLTIANNIRKISGAIGISINEDRVFYCPAMRSVVARIQGDEYRVVYSYDGELEVSYLFDLYELEDKRMEPFQPMNKEE